MTLCDFECGPLPGIGGPFDTATAFFEAWADSVKFKWDKDCGESHHDPEGMVLCHIRIAG
jgi:hypothetical protein